MTTIIMQDCMTELFAASYCGAYEKVRGSLRNGANPNEKSFTRDNCNMMLLPPEIFAIITRSIMLSDRNLRTNGFDNLYFPVCHQDLKMVKTLLAGGADPNAISLNGLFPLYLAAESGNVAMVEMLVSHGAQIDKTTPRGCTPLFNAADEGHNSVVRYLLSQGANPRAATKAGLTPYDTAREKGHFETARILASW